MSVNATAIMVYCGIVVGFGLLTILFTVLHKKMKKKVHKLKQECSSVTKATVVEMRIKKLVEDGHTRECWCPVYEYCVDGMLYQKEGSIANRKKLFTEGQSVQVYYDPNEPEKTYFPEEKLEEVVSVFLVLAIGFSVIDFFNVVIGLVILFH